MSASDIDIRKVLKILFLGGIVWALAFVACLGAVEWQSAMRIAIGPAVGWVIGNLAEVGMVVPNMEGLRK